MKDILAFIGAATLILAAGAIIHRCLEIQRFNRVNHRRQERLLRKIRDAQRGDKPQRYL